MKTEHLTFCPNCNSANIQFTLRVKDHYFSKKDFNIFECKDCTLRFTQDRPSEEEIGAFYDSKNYASHDSEKKINPFLLVYRWARSFMLSQKFELIRQFKPELKRILDYGTGEGYFVEFLQKQGKEAIGIEPSSEARTNFKKRTGQELKGSLKDLKPQDYFQVITLWHVLEHIHQLHPTIETLVNHLESKGILVIAIPNQNSHDAETFGPDWAAWDVPRHLYHWNSTSLDALMKTYKLNRVYTGQLPLDPIYIGLISARYQGNTPLSGLITGIKSYLQGKNHPDKGSTLLTIWMKN
jgi:SAM-dependent methyltransferase